MATSNVEERSREEEVYNNKIIEFGPDGSVLPKWL
jgi:hypothetical protein